MASEFISQFETDIQRVADKLAQMGGLVEQQLDQALEALQRRDLNAAEEAIRTDKRVDAMEHEIEEFAIRILTLRQPMASNLRETIAALKIVSTLERVGDLSKNIARRSIVIAESQPLRINSSIVRLGRQCQNQLAGAIDAFANRDSEKALAIWRRDVELDDLYNSLFRELVTYMIEDPRTIGLCTQLMFVAKNIERIGDHATSISEMVYYKVTGQALDESRPKGDPDASIRGAYDPALHEDDED